MGGGGPSYFSETRYIYGLEMLADVDMFFLRDARWRMVLARYLGNSSAKESLFKGIPKPESSIP